MSNKLWIEYGKMAPAQPDRKTNMPRVRVGIIFESLTHFSVGELVQGLTTLLQQFLDSGPRRTAAGATTFFAQFSKDPLGFVYWLWQCDLRQAYTSVILTGSSGGERRSEHLSW